MDEKGIFRKGTWDGLKCYTKEEHMAANTPLGKTFKREERLKRLEQWIKDRIGYR